MNLPQILQAAVDKNASDVILKDGRPPMLRIFRDLVPLEEAGLLTAETMRTATSAFLNDDANRLRFTNERHVDLAFDQPGLGRFRVNLFRQRGSVCIVLRIVPATIRSFEELNLPPVIERLANEKRGLILVTGPTGSGKSTTISAMLDHINRTTAQHVITIEDPIEYLHTDQKSVINQREIGSDAIDFPSALRSALRQDPDIIMVGEMRDLETIETAIMAAETGHLVLSTLHTSDAAETILRTISAFPEHKRDQVRVILANVIRGVLSQRLLPRSDDSGMVPAVEVMVGSARVREYVDKNKIRELQEVISQGHSAYGMQTFDQSLLALFRDNRISYEEALAHCSNPSDFEMQARGISETWNDFETRTPKDNGPNL